MVTTTGTPLCGWLRKSPGMRNVPAASLTAPGRNTGVRMVEKRPGDEEPARCKLDRARLAGGAGAALSAGCIQRVAKFIQVDEAGLESVSNRQQARKAHAELTV